MIELTAVDYIAKRGGFEIVYEMLSTSKKRRVRVKTFIKKDESIQSIESLFRMADWGEREMYDMYGVKVINHPNLKRILLPDDWQGHPLLKTYPLHGDEAASWYEVDKIFGKNARDTIGPELRDSACVDRYDTTRFARLGHEVDKGVPVSEGNEPDTPIRYQEEGGVKLFGVRLVTPFDEIKKREDNTMVVNFGPQHPSAHGQLRLILELQGEEVTKASPDVGYLHRGVEKMGENMIYNEFLPTTDRMDYIASTSNNYGYALAVEKLLGIEAPRRAEVIRTMLLELNRIISHLFWLATHALDVGAMSIFLYAFREREYALDLMEDYCGARLTHSAVRIGGVPLDLPNTWIKDLEKFITTLESQIPIYEGLLTKNRIWRMRLENVGLIPVEMAKSWGVTGVALRGSGVKWDLRKEIPYGLYSELDFD
ncbi:NADH-quinone oxidoreductase subunit D, partial [Aduncisulcus paluster]